MVACYRVLFPVGKDANDVIIDADSPQQMMAEYLDQAELMNADKVLELAHNATQKPLEQTATKEKNTNNVYPLTTTVNAKVSSHEVVVVFANRRYRVRGLSKNLSYQQLKVNILVSYQGHYFVDTLDLQNNKAKSVFIHLVSGELGLNEAVIKQDIGLLFLKLEALQDKQIQKALESSDKAAYEMNQSEQETALALLKDPNIFNEILKDFDACGVVGEETNKLVCYLGCISCLSKKPLAIMIQSVSAAGKTALMDAVLDFMPDELFIYYSAMTGQSLFYMGETTLKHKILAIAEEEGIRQAAYALKLLQSQGFITISSTGKDPITGELKSMPYRAEGPTSIFLTTTLPDVDEELVNRCIQLSVDEGQSQTKRIHEQQRFEETLEGLIEKEQRQAIRLRQHNVVRLLKAYEVVNPYASQMTFVDEWTRTRRDHMKYHGIIRSIVLLRQYQKTVKKLDNGTEYLEVSIKDIEIGNRIASEVLGRSLDELLPQTRRLLEQTYALVEKDCQNMAIEFSCYRFTRKSLREHTGLGDTQLRVHLDRLVAMEYVVMHKGHRGQSYEYELLYHGEGEGGKRFVVGLININQLKKDQNDNE